MYIKTLDDYDMSNLKLKIKKLYMYFLACDENQSNYGGLISFKYIKYKYNHDVVALANAIEEGLVILYDEYFDNVEVVCKVGDRDSGLVKLLVNIRVTEDNVSTNLYREINLGNEQPMDIIEYYRRYVD